MTPPAPRRLWFGVFVLAVFSLGAVAGGVLTDRYGMSGRRPFGLMRIRPGPPGDLVERLSRELELTPAQRQRLQEATTRMRPEGPRRADIAERMSRELDLTPAQRTELDAVLQRNGERLEQFRTEAAGRFETLRRQLDADIAAILTPEQRKKFEAERERRERPPGFPPGPGAPVPR